MIERSEADPRVRAASEPSGRSPLRVEEVQQRLRDAIIRGELRPNERLIEVDLAERLDVSRTPIRESIQRLVSDGLVTRHHRRGWIVHEHTAEEIREIYEVRKGLESWATRLATERASDAELARIEAVHDEAAALDVAALRPRLVELNEAFHAAVLEVCGNQRLRVLVQRSTEYFFNVALARTYSEQEIVASIVSQAAIVAAMKARDADGAERAARAHVDEALQAILEKHA